MARVYRGVPGWIVIAAKVCDPSQLLGRFRYPPCRQLDVQVEVEGEPGVILGSRPVIRGGPSGRQVSSHTVQSFVRVTADQGWLEDKRSGS